MVHLDRVVHDAKRIGGRDPEPAAQRWEEAGAAQRGQAAHGPQRYVERNAGLVERSAVMRDAGRPSRRLAASTWSATAPGAERKRTLPDSGCHT